LREIIGAARHVLLDFDGPVCWLFAVTGAAEVAAKLREGVQAAGFPVPGEASDESDPMAVFRAVSTAAPQAAATAHRVLGELEKRAAETARPTPGSAELIAAARRSGRTVSIVTNNAVTAVSAYLGGHGLAGHIGLIVGRDDAGHEGIKPSPYPVREAVGRLEAEPAECVLVGDSDEDVRAGQQAGVPVIGFAYRAGKIGAMARAGPDAVVTDLTGITTALDAAPLQVPPG
jgi:phosphoglycolate phosphatase-like HAD superfamily hydrolase